MTKIFGVTFDYSGIEKYMTLSAPTILKAVQDAERYKNAKFYSWFRITKIVEILTVDIHYKS